MLFQFHKYQGTGNDFILLDNRDDRYTNISQQQVKFLCDRHFGIGADGLMLLSLAVDSDCHFVMTYFNSDGKESSMCGNGGRCITAYARDLGLISDTAHFMAIDGPHESAIDEEGLVKLRMNDVHAVMINETYTELNTGSPHYVHFTEYVSEVDMKKEGRLIRYSPKYKDDGINVNFVERLAENEIFVRTYERGVEDETLSCGTGVTASAIASKIGATGLQRVNVKTPGGELAVMFTANDKQNFIEIWLIGRATFVFSGEIEA